MTPLGWLGRKTSTQTVLMNFHNIAVLLQQLCYWWVHKSVLMRLITNLCLITHIIWWKCHGCKGSVRLGAISPLFHNIFQFISYFMSSSIPYSFVKCGCSIYLFLTTNLICRGTDTSKYLRESLGLRDNGSRPISSPLNVKFQIMMSVPHQMFRTTVSFHILVVIYPRYQRPQNVHPATYQL